MNVIFWLLIAVPCILVSGFFFSSMLFSGGRSAQETVVRGKKTADAKVVEMREAYERKIKMSSAFVGKKQTAFSTEDYRNVRIYYVTFELDNANHKKVDLLVNETVARNLKKDAEVSISWKKGKCISCVIHEPPLEQTEWYIQ